eukprot:gene11597-11741_t
MSKSKSKDGRLMQLLDPLTDSLRSSLGPPAIKDKQLLANKQRKDSETVTYDKLARLFERPLGDAQQELGVGLTRFKELCREFGISRWPERIVRAIQNGKQHLLANEHRLPEAAVHMLLHRHAELLLLDYPSMQFKRHPAAFLDQGMHKNGYKKRKKQQAQRSTYSSS